MISGRKECGKCHVEKDKSEFNVRKRDKDGQVISLRLECRDCENKQRRIRYVGNRGKILKRNKEYTELNKNKVYRKQTEWKEANKEYVTQKRKDRYISKGDIIRKKRQDYYYNNRTKCLELVNNYYRNNLKRIRSTQRRRHHVKKATNKQYNIMRLLRGRIFAAIKNKGRKCARTKDLVGCSIPFLIKYIENLFTDGMNWENQGLKGWHIDHIKPCSKFDLSNPDEQKKCFHYTNLQPLWWYDNIKKSNKWEEYIQS